MSIPTWSDAMSASAARDSAALGKQIHLAAHFPGVNNTTVWSDPASGSQIDFASFAHLARTTEWAGSTFLAEALRLREMRDASTT
jgi:hypothetical protein